MVLTVSRSQPSACGVLDCFSITIWCHMLINMIKAAKGISVFNVTHVNARAFNRIESMGNHGVASQYTSIVVAVVVS